jgi:hypothetical protein
MAKAIKQEIVVERTTQKAKVNHKTIRKESQHDYENQDEESSHHQDHEELKIIPFKIEQMTFLMWMSESNFIKLAKIMSGRFSRAYVQVDKAQICLWCLLVLSSYESYLFDKVFWFLLFTSI